MDSKERKRRIEDLEARARVDPFIPWWGMDMIRILHCVINQLDQLELLVADQKLQLEDEQKRLNGLRDKYSEVLYKLQSGE